MKANKDNYIYKFIYRRRSFSVAIAKKAASKSKVKLFSYWVGIPGHTCMYKYAINGRHYGDVFLGLPIEEYNNSYLRTKFLNDFDRIIENA